jgi:transposase
MKINSLEKIIKLIQSKQLKQSKAAKILGVSVRQVKRWCSLYRQFGIVGFISKRKGVVAKNRISEEIKNKVITLAQKKYIDFGPTFFAEKLKENEEIFLSKEAVRKILIAEKIWKDKKERKYTIHQSRERRACLGELVQIDGSPHAWFEDRGPKCCLIVFIDDATSQLLYLHFEPVETTLAYFRGMYEHIKIYGLPCAYYSDKHMIFRVSNAKVLEPEPTQFERACHTLNIEGICAHSPQAKGRVERANQTLQDRLVKELRLRHISTLEEGNAFLPHYIKLHNKKFAVPPRKPEDAHQAYQKNLENLQHILSIQSTRKLSKNLELSFNNIIYQLLQQAKGRRLQQSHVLVCEHFNGEIILLYNEKVLPYKTIKTRTKLVADEKTLNDQLNKRLSLKPPHKPKKDHRWYQGFKTPLSKQKKTS